MIWHTFNSFDNIELKDGTIVCECVVKKGAVDLLLLQPKE